MNKPASLCAAGTKATRTTGLQRADNHVLYLFRDKDGLIIMDRFGNGLHDATLHRLFPEIPVEPTEARPERSRRDQKPAISRSSTVGKGHRERLRDRMFEGGPDALLDHELIEYLLALSIKRVDTKPLAKRLIKELGGIGPLLCADPATIRRVGGKLSDSTIAALKIAQAAANRMLEVQIREREVLGSWQALLDYLRVDMGHQPVERVRVLFLDTRNVLIANVLMSEGSIDESAVYIREILKKALELKATALIVVHNHPSGDPSPSIQDIRITRDLIEAGRPLKVTVHDHVIVGANGHSSLRGMGLI